MKIMFVCLLILPQVVLAAGSGSVTDLMWPAINFIVFFSFLGYKLKGPLKNYFNRQHDEVSSGYERAAEFAKKSKFKMKMIEEKMNNLQEEKNRIRDEAMRGLEKFTADDEAKTKERVERIQKDTFNRIEYEKNMLVREFHTSMVEQVVAAAKYMIKQDKDMGDKASSSLLGRIQ